MGEIAEDMIDGSCCSECGCYFIDEKNRRLVEMGKTNEARLYTHGYPVLCSGCWTEESELPKADVETL
jgi:hypothetical protein